jgi:DNA-binding beta-propeller fold protein YncE
MMFDKLAKATKTQGFFIKEGFMKRALLIILIASALLIFFGCEADQIMQSKGSETYVCDLVWGIKGTGNGEFKSPNALAIDDAGNVYVCDTGNKRIQVFNSEGNYQYEFGSTFDAPGSAPDGLQHPVGVAIGPNGHVWVSDNDPGNLPPAQAEACNRIVEFGTDGAYIASYGTYGSFGSPGGFFNQPHGLTFSGSGVLYVCDRLNNRLQTYDPITLTWTTHGSQGFGLGEFTNPEDVAIDSVGNILVADTEGFRIQKLDSSWNFITQYGIPGVPGSGDDMFNLPSAIDVDSNDFVYVLDTMNYRVMKFDQNLNYICKFGSPEGVGAQSAYGALNIGFGLAVNADGEVYVSDAITIRISRYIHS